MQNECDKCRAVKGQYGRDLSRPHPMERCKNQNQGVCTDAIYRVLTRIQQTHGCDNITALQPQTQQTRAFRTHAVCSYSKPNECAGAIGRDKSRPYSHAGDVTRRLSMSKPQPRPCPRSKGASPLVIPQQP